MEEKFCENISTSCNVEVCHCHTSQKMCGTSLEDIQLVGLATKSHQKSKLLLSAIESTQQRQSKWKLKL